MPLRYRVGVYQLIVSNSLQTPLLLRWTNKNTLISLVFDADHLIDDRISGFQRVKHRT